MGPRAHRSSRLVAARVADLLEGAFDEIAALFAEAVVDRGHRLHDAGGRACKGELAVFHFALVERECAVAEHDKAAVGEFAAFVFVEIKHDFFVGELVFANFHGLLGECFLQTAE